MIWVVGVLLALNLSLLSWNLHTRVPGAAPSRQPSLTADAGGRQLALLSELSADALRPRTGPITAVPGEAPTGAVHQPAAFSGDPSAAPRAAAGNFSTRSERAGFADTEGAGRAVAGGTVASPVCLMLGPLSAEAPLSKIRAWLEKAGATVDVRSNERREMVVYWVYFPPRGSRALALADVERLQAEGFHDVIAVRKGDMANAVSLGVFSRAESRDRRIAEMNQRGYRAAFSPRYQVKRATWIDVSMPADTLPEPDILARWPGLNVSRSRCAGTVVAPGKDAVQTIAIEPIAVGKGPAYNAKSPAPRRFYFSGSDALPSSTSDSSR